MKKLISLLAAAFFGILSVHAQTDPLKDPEVIWVGETNLIFNPDLNRAELKKQLNIGGYTQTLKKTVVSDKIREFAENDEHLTLANCILNGKQKVYHDSLLQKVMNSTDYKKSLTYTDTIITFDPKTFEKFTNVVENKADVYSIKYYKIRTLVYYHKKDMMYRTSPLAIAPVLFNGETLFWMPMTAAAATDLANQEVNWAVRLAYACPISGNNIKDVKKSDKYSFEYFNEKVNEEKITAYVPFDILGAGQNQFDKDEVKLIGGTPDTLITFDPVTKKESKQVVLNQILPADITEIRFVQDWFWDNKKQQLFYRPLGFAPLMKRYDTLGNYLNTGPMYYVREKGVE